MKTKIYQGGGPVLDEDELFNDGDAPISGQSTDSPLGGELVNNDGDPIDPTDPINTDPNVDPTDDPDLDPDDIQLTGVEQFLTAYGVQGGIITYEDGSTARFSELEPTEQSEILNSLVSNSVPTIEEKFNLDDDEINLLNTLRDSNMTSEEFINSLVDYRMQAVQAQVELRNTDYSVLSDDAIFVKNLRDSNPDITDEELASEISKAKELQSYEATADSLRKLYIAEQEAENSVLSEQEEAAFAVELEAQRHEIVSAVEGINDIGGAGISNEMKEYLLHDIMELNENRDPILMEKLFSSPEAMFKANWFLNYGENYMNEVNNYWKGKVSEARKEGYMQATKGMPGVPTNIGGVNKNKGAGSKNTTGSSFGVELSEEELFEQENN